SGSGSVAAVGNEVTTFKKGDAVYVYNYPLRHAGCPSDRQHDGAWAEYMLAPSSYVAPAPSAIDLTSAGAVPIAGLTAYQALIDLLKVGNGDLVLITAGAGGVGHLAVQIAARHGARVIATARQENHEFLRGLGAEEVIDYRVDDFVDVIHKRYGHGVDKA